MKIRRRRLTGTPLLVASAGAMMTVVSCNQVTTGNLVAPAQVELCVTVEPDAAEVMVSGVVLPAEDRCVSVYEGSNSIEATAEGYADYVEEIEVYTDTEHHVEMVAE